MDGLGVGRIFVFLSHFSPGFFLNSDMLILGDMEQIMLFHMVPATLGLVNEIKSDIASKMTM